MQQTAVDLLRILQSERLLKATLKRHPETHEGIRLYLSERRLAANIISTLGSKLLAFSPIAAAWEHAKHTFSLTEWTESESRQPVIRRVMLPSEIMDFPPCSVENGLTAVYFIPGIGVFKDTLDGDELFNHELLAPAEIPAFVPRPADHQFLRPWSAERAAEFGTPGKKRRRPDKDRDRDDLERDESDDLFS